MASGRIASCVLGVLCLVLAPACSGDSPDHRDTCGVIDVTHDGIIVHRPCGGCDPQCWTTSDTPLDGAEIITGGVDQNGEDVAYGTVDGHSGVVLGTSEGGVDTDGDGIPDSNDPAPLDANNDADGDGVPDAYEYHLGSDMNDGGDMSPADDEIYVVLPYEGPEVTREIPPDIPLTVRTADVYFLIDTTGSMSGEIANLRASLSSFVLPNVAATIENVQFGVGRLQDYGGDRIPYQHLRDITDDFGSVQSALDSLGTGTGSADWAESQTCALHAVATGEAIGCGTSAASCPAGRIGYPCFRPDAQPIIVLITDHEFHNGVWDDLDGPMPTGYRYECYEYSSGGCDGISSCIPLDVPCPSLQHVVTELNDIGARVVGVWSGWPYELGHVSTWGWGRTYPDFDDALDIYYTGLMTDSVDLSGTPFVYGIATDGSGIDIEVVNGINELVATMLLDVSSTWSDPNPAGPDSTILISDVDPTSCSMCDTIDHGLNIAYQVHPGSTVSFQITMSNDTGDIPATPAAQEFEVLIEIRGNGTSVLTERRVHVLVPGTLSGTGPATVGRYWHIYDAFDNCLPENIIDWTRLYYDAHIPAGTDITFFAKTASSVGGLDLATPVELTRLDTTADIASALEAAGQPSTGRYLMVEAVLTADTPGDSPVLTDLTVQHYCN